MSSERDRWNGVELACSPESLPPGTRQQHFARAAALFENARERWPMPSGYVYQFDASWVEEIGRFISGERLCCAFFDFRLEVNAGEDLAWLQVTGPDGTRESLERQGLRRAGAAGEGDDEARSVEQPIDLPKGGVHMEDDMTTTVRRAYGAIATEGNSCCDGDSTCGSGGATEAFSRAIGYSDEDLAAAPAGANMGLGCGNPIALAALKPGDTVLDLGSGAGFDCFLAANEVGPEGRVIGVDMTPEMVDKARENARTAGYTNVEFRLGEIEALPVPDASVDTIISNCVINLVPDKRAVFREAFRVLRPGGALAVSDIVLNGELPAEARDSLTAYVGCVAGAAVKDDFLRQLYEAGFVDVRVEGEDTFPEGAGCGDGTGTQATAAGITATSMKVTARKPAG